MTYLNWQDSWVETFFNDFNLVNFNGFSLAKLFSGQFFRFLQGWFNLAATLRIPIVWDAMSYSSLIRELMVVILPLLGLLLTWSTFIKGMGVWKGKNSSSLAPNLDFEVLDYSKTDPHSRSLNLVRSRRTLSHHTAGNFAAVHMIPQRRTDRSRSSKKKRTDGAFGAHKKRRFDYWSYGSGEHTSDPQEKKKTRRYKDKWPEMSNIVPWSVKKSRKPSRASVKED